MTSSWLLSTAAETAPNTENTPLSTAQKKRRKRKLYQKHKRNAVMQARKKGKPVGRAIRAFELRE